MGTIGMSFRYNRSEGNWNVKSTYSREVLGCDVKCSGKYKSGKSWNFKASGKKTFDGVGTGGAVVKFSDQEFSGKIIAKPLTTSTGNVIAYKGDVNIDCKGITTSYVKADSVAEISADKKKKETKANGKTHKRKWDDSESDSDDN